MRIQLGTNDFSRSVAETPDITLLNRYFEKDPTNQEDQVDLLARPALRKWKSLGSSATRSIYAQPGTFAEAIFPVVGNTLYRIDRDETIAAVGTFSTSTSAVSMAATDVNLFVADGVDLKYYTDNAYATGTLTASGAISNGEQVRIGSTYYQFASGSVDAGAPAGTSGNPWLVAMGVSTATALTNLYNAIGGTGVYGLDFSSLLTASSEVTVNSVSPTVLVVRAILPGTAANTLATTETGANLGWGAATMTGGGGTTFASVAVPDGDGVISVGVIAGYTICVIAQNQEKNGRFYWIEPGETTIDPLNFATAERSPDPVWSVNIVGDQFWLPGASTTEVWYLSGDGAAPFIRQQGRLFDKGVWAGTVVQIKDSVMAVGTDGTVYRITDQPAVVSTPGITQRLREAINAQRAA